MRFRTRLIILLLIIGLTPLMFMRVTGGRLTEKLRDRLSDGVKSWLIANTENRLRFIVDNYAMELHRGQQVFETALYMQALAVEEALAVQDAPVPEDVFYAWEIDDDVRKPKNMTPSPLHLRSRPSSGRKHELEISRSFPVFKLAPYIDRETVQDDIRRLSQVTPAVAELSTILEDLALWQFVSLENGLHSEWPAHAYIPESYDHRVQEWYERTMNQEDPAKPVWSYPFIDVSTRQIVFAISRVIFRPDGTPAGTTSIVMPLSSLFESASAKHVDIPNTLSMLVVPQFRDSTKNRELRILITSDHQNEKVRSWRRSIESGWFDSPDTYSALGIADDLANGMSGSRRLTYEGRDTLCVYGSTKDKGGIMILAPFEEILWPAVEAATIVETMLGSQMQRINIMLVVTFFLVLLLALLFSRGVTRPIDSLVVTAVRLARGDFSARTGIWRRDELGYLARIVDSLGPTLQDHVTMKRSMDLAHEVQQTLLPRDTPVIGGLDFHGACRYSEATGGDYFDYMDWKTESRGTLALAVGDVSGHGTASALLMTTVRALLRQRFSLSGSQEQMITDVNEHLARDVYGTGRFMTLFFLEADVRTNMLRWVRAGHDPAIVYSLETGEFSELAGDGLPLGVLEDWTYESNTHQMTEDEVVVIGTDGIWEAQNPEGEMFGKERLRRIIRVNAEEESSTIVNAIFDGLDAFCRERKADDDITVIVLKAARKTGNESEEESE